MDTDLQPASAKPTNTMFTLHRNALVMPLEGNMEAFTSGVFVDGQCKPESLQSRCTPAVPCEPEEVLHQPCFFGGYLFWHYGHFILESLSRLYAFAQCPRLPLLFCTPNTGMTAWHKQLLRMLNIDNEIIIIEKPTLVENLVLSPVGSAIGHFITAEQIAALGQGTVPRPEPNRKIWLSRSYLRHCGGIENEADIEARLASLGWEIVHPETLPLCTQVRLIGAAGHVAGFDGSAFITALLARHIHGHYTIFGRRNFVAKTILYVLQQKGISLESHVIPVKHISGEEALARFRMETPELVFQALHEPF